MTVATFLGVLVGLAFSLGLGMQGEGRSDPRKLPFIDMPPPPSPRPLTGEAPTCAGGCAQGVPERPILAANEVARLMDELAKESGGSPSPTLDSLLFCRESTLHYVREHGFRRLSPDWIAKLERELARRFVRVQFRMADEEGRIDVRLDKSYVLGEKRRHLVNSAVGVQPPRLSLMLHRVAEDRLWSRI